MHYNLRALRACALLPLTLTAAGVLLAPSGVQAAPPPTRATVPVDWSSVSASVANGSMLGTDASLSGSHVSDTPSSVTDGSWPYFSGPDFSPALGESDAIQIFGAPGYSYTLGFSRPTTNPILELGSLASRIDFPTDTPVLRLSGQSAFQVEGNTVSGAVDPTVGPNGLNDTSGTVKLRGTYTSITFSVTPLYTGPEDGIMVQVVTQPQFCDWHSVSANTAKGSLAGSGVTLRGTRVSETPSSVTNGSWSYFSGPDFSPGLAKSDAIEFFGGPGYRYTLRFSAQRTDPIVHLGSLASRIEFPEGTTVQRLSGHIAFEVDRSSVSGALDPVVGPDGLTDVSGTVRLRGTFSSITFSATPLYTGPDDGIMLQVGI
jgi:hypothetical protein